MWMECLAIEYQGLWNNIPQLAEEIMVDRYRDFWMRETGTGQQVAQLHERLMMMMMMMIQYFMRMFYMRSSFSYWSY